MKQVPSLNLFFLLAVMFSCGSTSPEINNVRDPIAIQLHEGNWISNFKNEVFIRCLKKMYPKDLSALFDSADASSSANIDHLGYNRGVLQIADSLAERFVKRPEASWTIEGAKPTLNVCLGYRNSAELDSLTLIIYYKYEKEE